MHARRDVRCAQTTKYWHCIPGRGIADSVSAEDALVYTSRRVEEKGGEKHADAGNKKKREKKSPRYFRAMHFPRSRASRVHIYPISAEMLTGAENAPPVIYISSRERAEKARIIAVVSDFPASGEKWLDAALIYHVSVRVWTRRGLAGSSNRSARCVSSALNHTDTTFNEQMRDFSASYFQSVFFHEY